MASKTSPSKPASLTRRRWVAWLPALFALTGIVVWVAFEAINSDDWLYWPVIAVVSGTALATLISSVASLRSPGKPSSLPQMRTLNAMLLVLAVAVLGLLLFTWYLAATWSADF